MKDWYEYLDTNNKLIWNLRDIGHTMRHISEGKGSQKRVLITLRETEGMTQRELTRRLDIQPGSVSEVIGKLEAEIPEAMYETETENFVRDYDNRLRMQGLDLATYFKYTGMNLDMMRQQMRPQAEKQVKTRLALEKIAELEGMDITEEDLNAEFDKLADNNKMDIAKVKELLEMMGTVDVEENFIGTRWSKLLINAAFSGMSAVLGCTFGEAAGPKESRRIVQALIKECIDVCAKGGIRIEPVQGKDIVKLLDYKGGLKKAVSFFIIPIAIRKHARLKASMLQDLEKGKLTEVDAINGAVSDYGRKVGCPTPMNDKVVEIIHKIEQGELKPGSENLQFFRF